MDRIAPPIMIVPWSCRLVPDWPACRVSANAIGETLVSISMEWLVPLPPSEKMEANNQHFPDIGQIAR